LCRKNGLYKDDLEDMTIGMCLDYLEECSERKNPEEKARKATQGDYDSF